MTDRIGVQFEVDGDEKAGLPAYRDTLWFESLDEFTATSKKQLDAMKKARHDAWAEQVLNPALADETAEPVEDREEGQRAALVAAQEALADAIAVLDG